MSPFRADADWRSAPPESGAGPWSPTRRDWLGAGMALGALSLAGCAAKPAAAPIGRVVVVGGGFGGATAAHYLRLWGGKRVEVTLVERQPAFVSCPMSNLVIGGFRRMADITIGYDGLKAVGVNVVQDEAVAIDAGARKLRLASGAALPYDRLVVAPGIDFIFDAVGGLQEAVADGTVTHAWKAGPQTEALRRQLEAMPDGGVFAISIPQAPFRCPPAPYERACLAAAYFTAAKPRAKVLVLDANPEIQSKKALFERAFKHYGALLEYRPNTELKEVSGRLAKFEFEDVRADVLNVIPPQRAADLPRSAGLVTINGRWAGVHWLTMESTALPGVHVLGDAVFPAALMPKSGHMANQQAKVAAAAILRLLAGEPVNPSPTVMNTCYSFVSASEAMHIATVHQYDAAEKTFKVVPSSGGVSAAASELEGRYAMGWAATIWADTVGG